MVKYFPSKGITAAETGLLLLQLTVTELEVTLVNLTLLGVILKYSNINSPITKRRVKIEIFNKFSLSYNLLIVSRANIHLIFIKYYIYLFIL